MKSHLERFQDWPVLARTASYRSKGLARICQVSPRQLERYFGERFGLTPQIWLEQLRLQEAIDLLHGGKHVKEIAFELGFSSSSHFIRKFKRLYHCTPLGFSVLRAIHEQTDVGARHRVLGSVT